MKLRIRAVKIVVKTFEKSFGAKFEFATEGLNIIRADNSMGKSTIYNSIIYALGLEMIIGNSADIPLTYIVTGYVEDNGKKLPVVESFVLLEIENDKQQIKTIKRGIVSAKDKRLVEVFEGPCVTNSNFQSTSIDQYYARISGSAQNERGFYTWLTKFLGWELPTVQRFNAPDTILFLECIFPLFIIEQKRGWVQLQSTVPQYGIKEVKQKALEFVLKLDSEKNNTAKREITSQIQLITDQWRKIISAINRNLKLVHGQSDNLPSEPVVDFEGDVKPVLKVSSGGAWISLEDKITMLKNAFKDVHKKIDTSSSAATTSEGAATLKKFEDELFQQEALERTLSIKLHDEISELELLNRRVDTLNDDIRQMQDAFKIAQMSGASEAIEKLKNCPLCDVGLDGTTLSQDVKRHIMSVDENLHFLKEELKAVEFLKDNCQKNSEILVGVRQTISAEVASIRDKIRAYKKDLVSDDRLPSTALLQEKIALEYDIKRHQEILDLCTIELASFNDLSKKYGVLRTQLSKIPKGLSEVDEEKIEQLGSTLKSYLSDFEFQSFDINSLSISTHTLHPVVEDFDWYFQASGSDNIRAIWAFTMALLSLSKSFAINHPGLLMYDEPGQHSAKHESLKAFLTKASTLCIGGGQIIITTSETITNLNNYLHGINVKKFFYDDKVRLVAETKN